MLPQGRRGKRPARSREEAKVRNDEELMSQDTPLGRVLTKSSLLKKLNANDIPRYMQKSRIPNSGDGVKCSQKYSCSSTPYKATPSERKAGSSSGVTYGERE